MVMIRGGREESNKTHLLLLLLSFINIDETRWRKNRDNDEYEREMIKTKYKSYNLNQPISNLITVTTMKFCALS